MRMYRVTENRNGEIILLAIFKYYQDAANYIIDQLYEPLADSVFSSYIEVENNYNIEPIDIENIT